MLQILERKVNENVELIKQFEKIEQQIVFSEFELADFSVNLI